MVVTGQRAGFAGWTGAEGDHRSASWACWDSSSACTPRHGGSLASASMTAPLPCHPLPCTPNRHCGTPSLCLCPCPPLPFPFPPDHPCPLPLRAAAHPRKPRLPARGYTQGCSPRNPPPLVTGGGAMAVRCNPGAHPGAPQPLLCPCPYPPFPALSLALSLPRTPDHNLIRNLHHSVRSPTGHNPHRCCCLRCDCCLLPP